jgi:hypothetical protein
LSTSAAVRPSRAAGLLHRVACVPRSSRGSPGNSPIHDGNHNHLRSSTLINLPVFRM